VDVDPETFNIDCEQVRNAIGPKTKAIVPVHLFGQCANMEEILAIASESNIYVIEDTAQAIGARYTFSDGKTVSAGCMGHIGCTSFFPSKNLGCYGDGGAMMTNDDDLAFKIRQIANHGQGQRYYHDVVGVNSRLDAIQAAILRVKLPHLNKYNERREKAASFYDHAFSATSKLITPVRDSKSTHVFHQYTLKTNGVDRNSIPDKLAVKGIPSMIYYPVPLHLQKAYSNLGYSEGQFPVTEDLCRRVFSLPMHTELTNEQLEFIVDGVMEAIS
jgi:dTDP-4-amino-4,6-dideoxygalactose transaminase